MHDKGPRASFRIAAENPDRQKRPLRPIRSSSPTSRSIGSRSCRPIGRATTSSRTRSSSTVRCTRSRARARTACRADDRRRGYPRRRRAAQLLGPTVRRRMGARARSHEPRADAAHVHQPQARGDTLGGTIALSGPFIAQPKVTLDLHDLDFDLPLRKGQTRSGSRSRRSTARSISSTSTARSRRPRPLSATARSRARSRSRPTSISGRIARPRASTSRSRSMSDASCRQRSRRRSADSSGKLTADGDVDTGFALRLRSRARRHAHRQDRARPCSAVRSSRATGSIRSRSVASWSTPGRPTPMFDGTSSRRTTCACTGRATPDLKVWLKRFGLPEFAQSAGGGGDLTGADHVAAVTVTTRALGHSVHRQDEVDAERQRHGRRSSTVDRGARRRDDRDRRHPRRERSSDDREAAHVGGGPARRQAVRARPAIVKGTIDTAEIDVAGRSTRPVGVDWLDHDPLRATAKHLKVYGDGYSRRRGVHQPPR